MQEQETPPPPPSGFDVNEEADPRARAPEPKARFSPLLSTVIGYVFIPEKDWEGVFKTIRESLDMHGQGRAIDLPHLHHTVHRMHLTWKREQARWAAENEAEWASMRKEAIRALSEEKAEGGKKTINKDDVEAQCALMFEDQFIAMRKRETDIKLTQEYLESAVKSVEVAVRVRTSGA